MTIVLIGYMGAGKTTIGRALAGRTEMLFLDTDDLIEEVAGASIDEIWARSGEEGFRDREEKAVAAACSTPGSVVATGAGAVTRAANREVIGRMRDVVYLRAPLDVLWSRAGASTRRPNARNRDRFDALFAERESLYEDLATIRLDATQPVEQIVDHLAEALDA